MLDSEKKFDKLINKSLKDMSSHALPLKDMYSVEIAADYDYCPPGHWGFHKQLHIAESIYIMV